MIAKSEIVSVEVTCRPVFCILPELVLKAWDVGMYRRLVPVGLIVIELLHPVLGLVMLRVQGFMELAKILRV